LLAGAVAWQFAIELCDDTGASKGVPGAWVMGDVGGLQGDKWNMEHFRTAMLQYDTSVEWNRLAAHANAHNVAIYPVQASGLESISLSGAVRVSQDTARLGHQNRQDTLVLLGRETGGKAILNTNDFRTHVAEMIEDSRAYYLLGFRPGASESGARHAMRVDVDRPGVQVRHRKSYQSKSADERVVISMMTTLLHARQENPLRAEISIVPVRPGEARADHRATLRIRVPFEALTMFPEGSTRHGMLTVFLATRDLEEGHVTPVRQASIPLLIPDEAPEDAFVYEVEMPVTLARHEVAVAVRDDFGGETSYLRRTFER
jgi:hypothetical protein